MECNCNLKLKVDGTFLLLVTISYLQNLIAIADLFISLYYGLLRYLSISLSVNKDSVYKNIYLALYTKKINDMQCATGACALDGNDLFPRVCSCIFIFIEYVIPWFPAICADGHYS